MSKKPGILIVFLLLLPAVCLSYGQGYNNFDASLYCRVYEVQKMEDIEWLKDRIILLEKSVHIEKVYLETHRDLILAERSTLEGAIKYLKGKGIRVAGGVTLVRNERNRFNSFCYSDQEDLEQISEIMAYTAGFFDEIILDDFYFTNCKCSKCIAARGDNKWSVFRMEQMTAAAETYVLEPARKANPDVQVIIKYPNWYEHFHYLGFNLEDEPALFDGIYTGTETRDPEHTHQHLQPYQSYAIMRYFEQVSPGKNGGGWVDPYARIHLDRYGEQLSLTAFARPREITLFAIHALIEEFRTPDGDIRLMSSLAPQAGYVLGKADLFLGELGNPVGIPCYRPYHSVGEDFLHNYLGMIGIPVEIMPSFPENSRNVLLTEGASEDPEIMRKIENQLTRGNNVVVTSGFVRAMEGKGFEQLTEVRYTDRKVLSNEYSNFRASFTSDKQALWPVLIYPTNDTWEVVTAYANGNGFPVMMQTTFGEGTLYILTIPDNFNDLYTLPVEALDMLREPIAGDLGITLHAPARTSLFLYDNETFIVHSFLSERGRVGVSVKGAYSGIKDLLSGEVSEGIRHEGSTRFDIYLPSHSYKVFQLINDNVN